MRTMKEIRRLYPSPGRVMEVADYCVGGAFCLSLGKTERFPNRLTLAHSLVWEAGLDEEDALRYAALIIYYNDIGHAEAAWDTLDQAIRAGGKHDGGALKVST